MYAGVDATKYEHGPVANADPVIAIWFISFMVIGSFFVIQLFVGVFIDTFQTVTYEAKTLSRKNSVASTGTTDTGMTSRNVVAPGSEWRNAFYTVTTQKRFDILIAVFIIANVVTMSAESFMSSEQHAQILAVFDFVFNFVFGAEVVAKMAGLYPAGYFSSNWNRFDFIVVMVPPPPPPPPPPAHHPYRNMHGRQARASSHLVQREVNALAVIVREIPAHLM